MKIRILTLILIMLNAPAVFSSDAACRVEAGITVQSQGMVEAALPAGLHFYTEQGLDLVVAGPDGKPRPFELYWRMKKSEATLAVKEESAQLLKDGIYRWQGKLDKPGRIVMVKAYLSTEDYVAKVDVYGLSAGVWKPLAKDAALYRVDNRSRAEIPVTPGEYSSFRLDFISYDDKYKQKPAPVDTIEAVSEKKGTEYSEQAILADFRRVDVEAAAEIYAALPGSGIRVKKINIYTAEPFTGEWLLEQEVISSGKREFIRVDSGSVVVLKTGPIGLELELDAVLKARNLKLTLKPKKYIGAIRTWETIALLPKLVFKAESAGVYSIQSGCGETAGILEEPSAADRGKIAAFSWGAVKQNPDWKPENLVEKFRIGGGPFKSRWYTWEAPVEIKEPGYYRVVLNRAASLGGYYDSIRVVKDEKQVPYFMSGGESVETALALNETYDGKTNISTWIIELPQASGAWENMVLQAEGIFSRTLKLETQNTGALSWEEWREAYWTSSKNGKSDLKIPLFMETQGVSKIRITIEHGDNSRIPILKASAFYTAPAICFLADSAAGYNIFGGNQDAKAPQYDMSLVQDILLTQEPKSAAMGECKPLASSGVKLKFVKLFEDTSWGLYAALGLVTIILIFIIAKLFPAVEGKRKK